MSFSGVKIVKTVGIPEVPEPNRFYLVESGGLTRFYLSDTSATLHLLNGLGSYLSISTGDVYLSATDSGAIYTDNPTAGIRTIALPPIEENLEFEFWVFYGNGLIVFSPTGDEILFSSVSGDTLMAISEASTVRLYAYQGKWIARYITGTWSVSTDTSSSS